MSGRIGDLNTSGSGCVDPVGLPSAEAMVTVGRVAIALTLLSSTSIDSCVVAGGDQVDVWEQICANPDQWLA